MKKMIVGLMTLATLLQGSAFAASVYRCQPADTDLATLKVYIQGNEEVSFATVVDGKLVPKTTVKLDTNLDTPAGFTGFYGVGGCSQSPGHFNCFAIWTNTLFVSDSMLSDSERGSVILNTEQYSCQIQ